jgi:hypothetical protein
MIRDPLYTMTILLIHHGHILLLNLLPSLPLPIILIDPPF